MKKIAKNAASEVDIFCIRYFFKTKQTIGKKSSETCLSTKTKKTCKNSVTLEHFQKWTKIKVSFCYY